MPEPTSLTAFLLSVEWRDGARGIELTLWAVSERGPVRAKVTGQEAVMFVRRDEQLSSGRRVPKPLQTKDHLPVDAVYFPTQRALVAERERLRSEGGLTFEADLKPSNRFTMERFVRGGVTFTGIIQPRDGFLEVLDPQVSAAEVTVPLRALSLDVETDGWDGPILSVALAMDGFEHVFLTRPTDEPAPEGRTHFTDEQALLEAVFSELRRIDPDALLGWNVVDFDLRVLQTRASEHGLSFSIGRAGESARVFDRDGPQSVAIARVPGRVVLDGVATLKNASMAFERYTLEVVAQKLLGRGKTFVGNTLEHVRRLYREDPARLAAYNLEDARLVRDIFSHARLIDFLVARAQLTGLLLDRQGGSVAAFDNVYLPRLHRRGFVAPDVGATISTTSPGGHVLESAPGFFTNVVSFDFRSLYPSIIRTFQIDPLGLWEPGDDPIDGFEGARFARTGALLPEIISGLHHERTRAREAGDETLSTAIKILMNSFYGVLGTPGSRFFDARLASSITRRGHEIIERSKGFFEAKGLRVIYGDTDSLFVAFDAALDVATVRREGARLANEANTFWKERVSAEHRLESFLELRLDAVYSKFLMPTLRHSERGSKKRYAGLSVGDDGAAKLVVRGLEAVRTDWTELAREAQRELLRRVFAGEPWKEWLLELRGKVERGEVIDQLIYRRRLRRDPSAYDANAPHVQVARQLADEAEADQPVSEVEYLITTRGPQPVAQRSAPIDVEHYLEKQLGPAVDVVLTPLGTSWERLAGRQLWLFGEGEL